MKYTLVIKPEAELDMLKSAQWYEEKQKNLGVRFLDEVGDKLYSVVGNPLQYQVRYKATRLALVAHFPYAVHFVVEGEKIIVLAVLGTRENPEKWQE